jgi:uncharacterized protein
VEITSDIPAGRQIIESYGEGRFRVSGQIYPGSVLVFPDRTLDWAVRAMAEVTLVSLGPVVEAAGGLDVLLLGCGARMAPAPAELRHELRATGLVIEPMDTGAACRTCNVLMAEGRAVAAALIAVD